MTPPSGSPQRICGLPDFAGDSSGDVTGDPAVDAVLTKLSGVLFNPRIAVVQDDNGWYVSPFKTVTGLYADVLGALSPQDVRDLMRAVRAG